MIDDPRVIYLEQAEEADPSEGRTWCEKDRVWEHDTPGVRYVRADLVEGYIRTLRVAEILVECQWGECRLLDYIQSNIDEFEGLETS